MVDKIQQPAKQAITPPNTEPTIVEGQPNKRIAQTQKVVPNTTGFTDRCRLGGFAWNKGNADLALEQPKPEEATLAPVPTELLTKDFDGSSHSVVITTVNQEAAREYIITVQSNNESGEPPLKYHSLEDFWQAFVTSKEQMFGKAYMTKSELEAILAHATFKDPGFMTLHDGSLWRGTEEEGVAQTHIKNETAPTITEEQVQQERDRLVQKWTDMVKLKATPSEMSGGTVIEQFTAAQKPE